jgi:hypothetical protein
MPPQPGVIVQDGRSPSPPRASWNEAEKTRGRPKGLTTSKKRERDKEIVRDRLVNDLSWGALALKYDLDERSCRRIVAAHRKKNVASLSEIDPEGEVWDHLQGFEAQIERMRDLREDARAQRNLNAVLGAERLITTLRQAKLDLMQEAGLLPRNLGSLRRIFEVEEVVGVVMSVLDRVERGDVAAADAKQELLVLLEPPSPNTVGAPTG